MSPKQMKIQASMTAKQCISVCRITQVGRKVTFDIKSSMYVLYACIEK